MPTTVKLTIIAEAGKLCGKSIVRDRMITALRRTPGIHAVRYVPAGESTDERETSHWLVDIDNLEALTKAVR